MEEITRMPVPPVMELRIIFCLFISACARAYEVDEMRKRAAGRNIDDTYDKKLFEELRSLRAVIAKSENVPAFVLFSDAALAALAEHQPQSIDDLDEIPGFGAAKINKYGEQFVKAIADYKIKQETETEEPEDDTEDEVEEVEVQEKKAVKQTTNKKQVKDLKAKTLKLFKSGFTASEIALQSDLKKEEVENHIQHFVLVGDINVLQIVNKLKLIEIVRAVQKFGDSNPEALKKTLGDDYTLHEIISVINYWKRVSKEKK